MKRIAIKLVVFLLLGAVTTVVVAWGCALWGHGHKMRLGGPSMDMRRLGIAICVMWLLVSQPACSPKPAAHSVPAAQYTTNFDDNIPIIEKGITLSELRVILQETAARRISLADRGGADSLDRSPYVPPGHRFTVRHGSSIVLCVRAMVDPWGHSYYFLFFNDRLARIYHYLPREIDVETREDGSQYWRFGRINSDLLVESVLGRKDLSTEEFVGLANRRVEASRRASRMAEYSPALALANILTGGMSAERAERREHCRRHRELMDKFDGTKIQLGMSREQVEDVFGPAKEVEAVSGGNVVCTYGEAALGLSAVPWVSVEFREGEVVSLVTNHTSEMSWRLKEPRRQRCPDCGYPVGANPICTECGKRLPARLGS